MLASRSLHKALWIALLLGLLALGCEDPEKVVPQSVCTDCFADQDALIQGLALAYRTRDYDKFVVLFPTAADNTPYYFFLNEPENGVTNWDLTEELRIHRRMFRPDQPLSGEVPVDPNYWLNSISITIVRTATTWVERPDLNVSQANPNGLDPAKWKATEAEFHANVLFDTQTDMDFSVDDRANFIVIEDLTKAAGAAHKFLIYRWEDLGNFNAKPTAMASGARGHDA